MKPFMRKFRHDHQPCCHVDHNAGWQNELVLKKNPRKLRRFPTTETVPRSNRRWRWGSGLAQKGLATFRPALVTLSLDCLCRSPWTVNPEASPQSGRCATVFQTGVQNHCAQQVNGGGRQQKSMAGHLDWRMRRRRCTQFHAQTKRPSAEDLLRCYELHYRTGPAVYPVLRTGATSAK